MLDFEDALQSASALAAQADHLLTRNIRDFRYPPVPGFKTRLFNPVLSDEIMGVL